jgi:uncharacterized membrane protein
MFSPQTLAAIEAAISATERTHSGEIRFAIEAALDPAQVWRGLSPRARALEIFAALGVWDTDANNGILIYVLLADRDVEIVADRAYNGRVDPREWAAVCTAMEARFRAGEHEAGAILGIQQVGEVVARHFPNEPGSPKPDELPNRPVLI